MSTEPNSTPSESLDVAAAAARLGVCRRTLQSWRARGIGPPWFKSRPASYTAPVLYPIAGIETWLQRSAKGA